MKISEPSGTKWSRKIAAAAKRELADIVIINGRIIDVFNQTIISGDVAITDGLIVGIGEYEGHVTIDAKDRFICPGFIDGHVHIESAMLPPNEFAKVVLPHGVTTVIADPHEIANVCGEAGLDYMIASSEDIPLEVYFMLPSCVPATPFENAGARLDAEQLAPYYKHGRVLGLGEVMNAPAVISGEAAMLDKLISASSQGKLIDGHAAGLHADAINVYMTADIRTDHECTEPAEVLDRLSRGMYVMLREGSAAKNLKQLSKAVNSKNARRCLFVTDDRHLDDLMEEGSIDHCVRLAIAEGIEPLLAIQMATLNAAECFGLRNKGAIAPGYAADLIFLHQLEEVTISQVYKAGKLVADEGEFLESCTPSPAVQAPMGLMDSIRMLPVSGQDLQITFQNIPAVANIIEIIPNSILTRHLVEEVDIADTADTGGGRRFQPSTVKDQLKMIVVERHKATGNVGVGILKGLGIASGAIVSTIAHDSHNVVAAGTNDADLLLGLHTIQEIKGGIVVIDKGKVLASLSLPVAGLLSDQDHRLVSKQLTALNDALRSIGFQGDFNPFLTLSFLALPVIPEIKLTDRGLFHVRNFEPIGVEV
ncbi:adenine deaminase [Paenibacillus eucommiae]|uniref:Adenine deaminase n=1 Tax=Paenibacillus eucommiae TaxID=1355755 RepID=A0ABS4J9W3_9BACL|nr:adenine deaminase [Paenibacillus eucommiae]MBP1996636.1 adenine deaminase [Paenibacillus eucommiae]